MNVSQEAVKRNFTETLSDEGNVEFSTLTLIVAKLPSLLLLLEDSYCSAAIVKCEKTWVKEWPVSVNQKTTHGGRFT